MLEDLMIYVEQKTNHQKKTVIEKCNAGKKLEKQSMYLCYCEVKISFSFFITKIVSSSLKLAEETRWK